MSGELTTIDVTILHETDGAILVESPFGSEIWIPKSLIENEEGESFIKDSSMELEVPEWFATKEGLI